MKNLDIFVDLEGIGIPGDHNRCRRKIDLMAEQLPSALLKEGYKIASLTGFACYKHPHEVISPLTQTNLRKMFTSHEWTMVWSDHIADLALMSHVEDQLAKGKLSESVMVVTSDHDFIKLIRLIQKSGREALVSGQSMNKRLQMAADRAMPFWEMLGGHPDKMPATVPDSVSSGKVSLNPLPIPDIGDGLK